MNQVNTVRVTMSLQVSSTLGSQLDIYEAPHHDKSGYSTQASWEIQAMARSPSQTFYHLGVYLKADKSAPKAILILRDWPRKRYSQHWSRDSAMNPGEKVITFEEFQRGDYKQELTSIFGATDYQKLEDFVTKLE